MPRQYKFLVLFSLSLLTLLGRTSLEAGEKVTIYRDTFGVPHIYADTEEAGIYGLGYAQAEDRLDDIYESIRTGTGRMAQAFGEKYVQQDYIMRLCRNEELAREYWKTAPPHLVRLSEAFMGGIQAYIDANPDKVPAHAVKLEPWQLLTVGRAMILRWPLGTIFDDLKNGKRRTGPPEGPGMRSNEWAVSKERSADGVPIVLADPHLTWEGLAVMYEARVHAGDLHMNGYFLIGSPIMGIGHNRHVGWALTTGGPDTSDVYQMKIKAGVPIEYEYDGEWRKVEVKTFAIPVKGKFTPVIKPAIYTHLGPLVEEPDLKNGKAMVGASPYFDQTGLFDQFYQMLKAKNGKELFKVIGMNQFNEQNIMFGDVDGNIGYVRNGRVPIRPEGYDWNAPVPGHTSKTAWKGIHPVTDLVHIFNPKQGYMQNCNISPENMIVGSEMTPDKYKDYIYNVSWDDNNPRGRRTIELLAADDSVTKEEALAYALDVYDRLAPNWQNELTEAVAKHGKSYANNKEFAKAVKAIQDWDGHYTPDQISTTLFKKWRLKCGANKLPLRPIADGKPLDAKTRVKMLSLLAETIKEMQEKYGKWDVAWGDIHKVGRGDIYYPVGGAEYKSGDKIANFAETLFDVRCVVQEDGTEIANNGSMAMMLMFFHKDGVESYTCTPWGQSGRPESPHYMDQGKKLYSPRQMKPTWWKKSELMKNLESTKELQYK